MDDFGVSRSAIIAVAIVGAVFVAGSFFYFSGRHKANFEVENFSISGEKVVSGDSFSAEVDVANTGDVEGSYTARL